MNEKCKCGRSLIFEETPNLVHYGKLTCPKHGFIKWVKNPSSPEHRRKIFNGYKQCGFCCRKKEQLGIKETIEGDHIIPLEMGGKDEKENIIPLCTACHKLKNWMVTYMNKHMVKQT